MTIRVTLINPSDRRFYLAQWDDPVTGRTKTRSTKTTVRRDAERFAARLEDELNAGTHKPAKLATWRELRERFTNEVSKAKAPRTALKTQAMFNAVERLFDPSRVDAVADAGFVSKYAAKLREEGLTEYTVRGHLSEIRKVLRWASRMGLIHAAPHIEFPRPVGRMKGRPVNDDEFGLMVKAIRLATLPRKWTSGGKIHVEERRAIPNQFVDRWNHYLVGLYLSGLRLEESLLLHWTDDSGIMVDLSGKRPMFRIQAKAQKSRQFQLLPMTPDFAKYLDETPKRERVGYVFNPVTYPRGKQEGEWRPLAHHCGRVISAIGKASGVKVNETKYASAHDLRRAFGFRWAKLVMPAVLKELMRHEAITTTMEFYVGSMAEDAADAAFRAMPTTGNTSGNTPTKKRIKP